MTQELVSKEGLGNRTILCQTLMGKKKKQADVIPLKLKTKDRQVISGSHYSKGHANAVILAHGFFNNKDVYLFKKLSEDLSEFYDVVTFDFRGHGKSSGLFEWTSHEDQDLTEVIAYTKAQGYNRIGLLGFSLGAAVALIVASQNKDIHSVIAVSAPVDFWQIDYHFWEPEMLEDLKLNIGYKGIGKGVRPGNPFLAKIRPLDVVAQISPTPVFFIHGSMDWLIKPRHSEKLFEQAGEPKRIKIIPDAGHAEKIYDTHPREFLTLCREWLDQTLEER
ncbi:MAG TPA: hypothetical protein DD723_09570 [Candidatus Omnitrophica bacterium]|nr:MAG: hypothetical protein A2Z81_02960 [Omnitrophica WOR_2 bacterium GWA2_45_18]OGX19020.1 MAG: hypothetical protein A2Y04_00690 [Omnitrophica WOR_2 bacterium GWC2_45_7]HBR15766.1 hypothetical protein [Candidatus Omnitrophota bacterium]